MCSDIGARAVAPMGDGERCQLLTLLVAFGVISAPLRTLLSKVVHDRAASSPHSHHDKLPISSENIRELPLASPEVAKSRQSLRSVRWEGRDEACLASVSQELTQRTARQYELLMCILGIALADQLA